MSNKNTRAPRVYIVRHGETKWTISGQCTGKSEIPLTENGAKQVANTGEMLVGPGKLIDPSKIMHIFSSPRVRAVCTLDTLLGGEQKAGLEQEGKITLTEDIAEWDYGDYEGMTLHGIRAYRENNGLGAWDIWTEGCEGGESAEQVRERLDRLIQKIKDLQGPRMHSDAPADVLVVAHGHILRAFTKRWLKYPMDFSFPMMMEPAAVGVMGYAHHNISEPAILIGMDFPRGN